LSSFQSQFRPSSAACEAEAGDFQRHYDEKGYNFDWVLETNPLAYFTALVVFCRARHEQFRESDALRRVFEGVVAMCIASGLVGGEAFSVDASLIKADVDKKKRIPGEQPISWRRSRRRHRERFAGRSHGHTRYRGRDIEEDVRDRVRALANTEAFQQSRRERKKIAMRFAHMKRIFRLDRLRLRGLSGARDEVLLTATAQNLRRLVKFLCRPPPLAAQACPA